MCNNSFPGIGWTFSIIIRRGLALDFDISTMSLDNYIYLFSGNADSQKYFMWYKNSLVITIVSVALTLIICYFVAYGLTMYNYKLKNFLFFLVIATMMVPFEILMLPYQKMFLLQQYFPRQQARCQLHQLLIRE